MLILTGQDLPLFSLIGVPRETCSSPMDSYLCFEIYIFEMIGSKAAEVVK